MHSDERPFTALIRPRDIKTRLRLRLEVTKPDEPDSGKFVYPTNTRSGAKKEDKAGR